MSESPAEIEPTARIAEFRGRTPARVLVGRAGTGYRTETQLSLRADHAFARDAVQLEIDLQRDLGSVVEKYGLFLVQTEACDKSQYLKRPDLGRRLNNEARHAIIRTCTRHADLQIVIGDGLSTPAVAAQVPELLPRLIAGAIERDWSVGQTFVIRYCRVGVLNDVGVLLNPKVVVLLIGERPGLATSKSLSAYMAYQPRAGHTDAQRNLVSNIHQEGISPELGARRILDLVEQLHTQRQSGIMIKERLGSAPILG